jgi:hypothetical protein
LAELQNSFAQYLRSPAGESADSRLVEQVRRQGLAAEPRLSVYKYNLFTRLIEALVATYPAVLRLVGAEFFRFAAQEYIASSTPRSPTLLEYGATFPEFLRDFAPAASVPYLADVARLEYLYLESYHAAEAVSGTAEDLQAILAGQRSDAGIHLHPSARLMSSPFPVSRIWEINVRPTPIDDQIEIPGESEHLLIVRPQAVVEVRRVAFGAHAALAAFARGASLREAQSAASTAEPALDLHTHLVALAAGETFCFDAAAR